MRVQIVHFSDIHIRRTGNAVVNAVDQLAQAICSVDPCVAFFVIAISGDITFSGGAQEYRVALKFLNDLKEAVLTLRAGASVVFVTVPGNHDCVLPEAGAKLRETIVQGVIPSLRDKVQDPGLMSQLMKAQAPYQRFRRQLQEQGTWDNFFGTVIHQFQDKKIQFNLYNTAIVSRRNERQGELHIPQAGFDTHTPPAKDIALCVSLFHHSYLWLESNVAIAFRNHVERTSDVAMTGHQHYGHDFNKENTTGERVLYLEAAALQDEQYPKTSTFQALLLDFDSQEKTSVTFRRSKDLYRRIGDTGWQPLTLNRTLRADFRLDAKFEHSLNETGTPLRHRKGDLYLRDIFVFPDLLVRSAGLRHQPIEVRGEDILAYLLKARRVLFQGGGLQGKTSLAKMLVWEVLRQARNRAPLLMTGPQFNTTSEAAVVNGVWKTFSAEYSAEMLEEFKQLSRQERVLVVDDWHRGALNADGRKEVLKILSTLFDTLVLFTDELFQIHEVVSHSADTLLQFDLATFQEFGHRRRGGLIDRWVSLGREYTGDKRAIAREINDKERLIQSLLERKTLPSVPFIVLCLLQADEEGKADVPEAGSFGYLYEVFGLDPWAETIS